MTTNKPSARNASNMIYKMIYFMLAMQIESNIHYYIYIMYIAKK